MRARRWITALGIVALGGLGLTIFVLPFAFPTPPPIITRFHATRVLSPNDDGRRDEARVSIRVREASIVTLDVRKDGNVVTHLLTDRDVAPGWLRVIWDGRDDSGQTLPDGAYSLKLQASSGQKRFNASRRIEIDTREPSLRSFDVVSAALVGPGAGQCEATLVADDAGTVRIDALPPDGGEPVASIGPRPLSAGGSTTWAWSGRAGGEPLTPGLYVLRARLQDPPGNRMTAERTCWVGNMVGTARRQGADGERVALTLRDPGGSLIPSGTPVTVSVHRRVGTPGEQSGPVVGARLAGPVTGTASGVRIVLPPGPASGMWVVASARQARALVPLAGEGSS